MTKSPALIAILKPPIDRVRTARWLELFAVPLADWRLGDFNLESARVFRAGRALSRVLWGVVFAKTSNNFAIFYS